jgi:nucleoside-diphosphate-sugar epimerase
MNILITGGKGNLATIIHSHLSGKYTIVNPSHQELDLLDFNQVDRFLKDKLFDVLIHTAIMGGRRTKAEDSTVFYNNVLMFENIMKFANQFKMIINMDSAAIYDRSTNIMNRREDEIWTIPTDLYGFSKYVIYQRTMNHSNIYNFRIFNIFHINEEPDRFIKSCFLAKQNNTQITIYEDKYFDFVYETDFVRVLQYYLSEHSSQTLPKTFNLCYEKKYKLSEIAEKIIPIENILILSSSSSKSNYSGNGDILESIGIQLDGFESGLDNYQSLLQDITI